jgi:putative resolvase
MIDYPLSKSTFLWSYFIEMRYYTTSQYAFLLGIHPQTLRKHERLGIGQYIKPVRTAGNHRRYPVPDTVDPNRLRVGYARVSCSDQKADLPRQVDKLKAYNANLVVFTDIGSGLNCKKRGLTALVKLLLTGKVTELVLTYKDRLLRFGSELIFLICDYYNIQVTILNDDGTKTVETQMTEDILAILTVFSARMHGARAHKNKVKSAQTQLRST